jgi:hypothetical protein
MLRVPEQAIPSMQQSRSGDSIISLSYVLRFNALPGIETEIPIVITSLGYRNGGRKQHQNPQQQYVRNALNMAINCIPSFSE